MTHFPDPSDNIQQWDENTNRDNPLEFNIRHAQTLLDIMVWHEKQFDPRYIPNDLFQTFIVGTENNANALQYYFKMKSVVEKLEKENIPYRINFYYPYSESDGLKKLKERDQGVFLEFLGQTWCPYYGWRAREMLYHRVDRKDEDNNNRPVLSDEFVVENLEQLRRILKINLNELAVSSVGFYSKKIYKDEDSVIQDALQKTNQVAPVGAVAFCIEERAYTAPFLLEKEDKPLQLQSSRNFVQEKAVELFRLETRASKKREKNFFDSSELQFADEENVEAMDRVMNANVANWQKEYMRNWKKLCDLQEVGTDTSVLTFVRYSSGDQKVNAVELSLNLNSEETLMALVDFMTLKNAPHFLFEDGMGFLKQRVHIAKDYRFHLIVNGVPWCNAFTMKEWESRIHKDRLLPFNTSNLNEFFKEFLTKYNFNSHLEKSLVKSQSVLPSIKVQRF